VLSATSCFDTATTATPRPLLSAGPRSATGSTYVGRTDDVFKESHYKICPFELESVHRALGRRRSGGGARTDPTRLTVPKASISLAAGWALDRTTADAIFAHAHRNLRPTNLSGASKSWNYRRPSPARCRVSTCEFAKTVVNQPVY
jgi:hypothetical protein